MIDNQNNNSTRRDFILKIIRATGCVTLGSVILKHLSDRRNKMERRNEYVDDEVLANNYSANYPKLMQDFVNASTPDLNRMYFGGFSSLLLAAQGATQQWKYDKLQEIKKFSDKYYTGATTNRHRAYAFSSSVSSHFIPFCTEADNIIANDIITETLEFPQREVQEIVFQNLICSLTSDNYSWEHFYVTDRMLEAIHNYIGKRESNALLNTGCCVALQFLAYYETALITRKTIKNAVETRKRQIKKINAIYDSIINSSDTFCWLQKSWLYDLKKFCKSTISSQSESIYILLPPQITELIMGWKYFSDPSHPWHTILVSAIRFLLLSPHLNELIVRNEKASSLIQDEYGIKEASVALQKSREFFLNISLHKDIYKKVLQRCDGSLKNTVAMYGKNYSQSTVIEEMDPSWSLVPFRNYLNPLLPSKHRPKDAFYEMLIASIGGGFIGSSINDFVKLGMIYLKPIIQRTPTKIRDDFAKPKDSIESSMRNNDKFNDAIQKFEEYLNGKFEVFLSEDSDLSQGKKENETNKLDNNGVNADRKHSGPIES